MKNAPLILLLFISSPSYASHNHGEGIAAIFIFTIASSVLVVNVIYSACLIYRRWNANKYCRIVSYVFSFLAILMCLFAIFLIRGGNPDWEVYPILSLPIVLSCFVFGFVFKRSESDNV